MGRGLLTPQQSIFELTARPGAFDLKGGQAALQRLRYGLLPCGSAGPSEKGAAVLQVPNNVVVAKKPPPHEPPINKRINDALHERPGAARQKNF